MALTYDSPFRFNEPITLSFSCDLQEGNMGHDVETAQSHIDRDILTALDDLRAAKFRLARMVEAKHDMAALERLDATHQDSQAAYIVNQGNEDMPVVDPDLGNLGPPVK